ncbi:hypothetical protein HanIR_Chr15g0733411 [Helianthus annuus]|nr:hypothetical protein HanIR_Chr15g0733411 [Helianthus annuus]
MLGSNGYHFLPDLLLKSKQASKQQGRMGGFERQVETRAKDVKRFFKKGVSTIGNSFKKGWYKLKRLHK